jgi:hypothetical protein
MPLSASRRRMTPVRQAEWCTADSSLESLRAHPSARIASSGLLIIVRVGTVITVPRAHGKPVREHLMCERVRALGRPASAGNWGRTLTCRRGTARSAAPARRGGAPQTRAPSKRGNSMNWDQRPFEIEKTIEMRGPRGDRRNETGCRVRGGEQQLSAASHGEEFPCEG